MSAGSVGERLIAAVSAGGDSLGTMEVAEVNVTAARMKAR